VAERRRRRVLSGRDEAATPPPAERSGAVRSRVPDESWAGADLDQAVAERGLRGLIGGGSSQVSPAAALRARDAARPRDEDLARSEAQLQVVRRNWTPREGTVRSDSRET
jgi:hypothetical protein